MSSAAIVIGSLRVEENRERANSIDTDEAAHDGPPHLDLRCFQIQLF